jgi:hypothetical protein
MMTTTTTTTIGVILVLLNHSLTIYDHVTCRTCRSIDEGETERSNCNARVCSSPRCHTKVCVCVCPTHTTFFE